MTITRVDASDGGSSFAMSESAVDDVFAFVKGGRVIIGVAEESLAAVAEVGVRGLWGIGYEASLTGIGGEL